MYLHHRSSKKRKKGTREGKKPLIHPVTHLQHVFIVCCICRPFTLWPHLFPSAKYTRQLTAGNSYWGLMVLTPPHFFPFPLSLSGHPISSSSLFLPPPSSLPHNHPLLPPPSPSRCLPPLSLSLSPSPIPLSQLPVELAAIQDSADGSVIRSASLRSLFSSPLFFLSFFPRFNQITEENFSPFGFEFCRHSLILAFLSGRVLIENDRVVQNIGSFIPIMARSKSNCSSYCVATSHNGKECKLSICKPFSVYFCLNG